MVKKALAVTAAALLIAPNAAGAATFDFEAPDTGSFQYIGPAYGGLTFTNWAVVDGPGYGPSGYTNVITSGQQSACGCASDFSQTYTSISNASAFNLVGGNFASAWNDGATLLVEGYLGASLLYSQSFVLNTAGPQALSFGFNGVDLVNFSISGGTPSGLPGQGDYFAVDDLVIDAVGAVPEPATWAFLVLGFGAIGASIRTRKARLALAF